MIRSSEQLRNFFREGGVVSLQPPYDGSGPLILVVNETGETVHRQALNTLLKKGEATVRQYDLCGDPAGWGAA